MEMGNSSWRTSEEIAEIYSAHIDAVYRLCYAYMKNTFDAEDAAQDTFIKLFTEKKRFESTAHERAWLLRVATNLCKNKLKSKYRYGNQQYIEDVADTHMQSLNSASDDSTELFGMILSLPDKYKTIVYMYYYEGYSTKEIAKALKRPPSTIRNQLRDARILLKNYLGGDSD